MSGQKAHEKMLNITNYQRTTNQNYNEVSSHTCQNDHLQKNLQMINAGGGIVKREASSWIMYTVVGNVHW